MNTIKALLLLALVASPSILNGDILHKVIEDHSEYANNGELQSRRITANEINTWEKNRIIFQIICTEYFGNNSTSHVNEPLCKIIDPKDQSSHNLPEQTSHKYLRHFKQLVEAANKIAEQQRP